VKTFGTAQVHLFAFPADSVREVILGSKCSATTESAIRGAIAGWSSPSTFFKCDIDDSDYKMVRKNA